MLWQLQKSYITCLCTCICTRYLFLQYMYGTYKWVCSTHMDKQRKHLSMMCLIFKCMMNAYSLKFTFMLWFYSKESSINFNENLKLLVHSIYVFYIVLCFSSLFPLFLLGGGGAWSLLIFRCILILVLILFKIGLLKVKVEMKFKGKILNKY